MLLTDEHCLIQACYAALRDDAPWGIYADWLREHGQDRRADRLPVLRRMLVSLLPVALPIAERLD